MPLHQYAEIQIHPVAKKGGHEFLTSPIPALDINHKASKPLAPLQEYLNRHTGKILFCAET